MIRAVIFDMDGLLLDSEVYWAEARVTYCAAIGCEWRPEDEDGVKGFNSAEWAEAIARRCDQDLDRDVIIREVNERMRALYQKRLPLLPGAVDTVRSLANRYPLAIASSSPRSLIDFALSMAGIRDRFRVAVSADQVGKGKPAPDVFLAAAKALGVPPAAIAVFEDSSAGIQAARSAGVAVIAVPNHHYPPSEHALRLADLVLSSLEDFSPEMLDSLTSHQSTTGQPSRPGNEHRITNNE